MLLKSRAAPDKHAAWFAAGLPGWVWQPSDAQSDAFGSVAAWCAQAGVANVREPVLLDVLATQWPSAGPAFTTLFDALYCANMLHISPWANCAALMQGAARHLAPQGVLILYGPYLERDVPTSPGNRAFDDSLRQTDPAWGLRQLDDVLAQAAQAGLHLRLRITMPANNLLLVLGRKLASAARAA